MEYLSAAVSYRDVAPPLRARARYAPTTSSRIRWVTISQYRPPTWPSHFAEVGSKEQFASN